MNNGQEDVSSQPLVIVRRRRNTDEPHHGGVWKIAYADFMTAMMAFFLVMWLINAADKKTIVQVAAYFNPMRLTDRYDAPKGLEDLTETASRPSEGKTKKGHEKPILDSNEKRQADHESREDTGDAKDEAAHKSSAGSGGRSAKDMQEIALFDNPGNLLEKLADEARGSQPTTTANSSDGNINDPFDRIDRGAGKSHVTLNKGLQVPPAHSLDKSGVAKALPVPMPAPTEPPAPLGQDQREDLAVRASPGTVGDMPKQQNDVLKKTPATLDQTKKEDKTHDKDHEKDNDKTHDKDQDAKKLQDQIGKAVSQIAGDLPAIDVKSTAEGLLISLTDDANFGMFEVGSARPRPELVLVMEKIAAVLRAQGGDIVIRGHTDSRPYKSRVYDNWRLSAARAQMAYYMLTRAGVEESRVVAIEGRADRDPKVPTDTLAAPNRRIDILLKEKNP